MKISALMVPNPITVTEKASISEAIQLMKVNSFRHLPVVSQTCELKGFVTLSDLKQGLIPSMVGDLTLKDLMITDPITVGPDDDVEVAAQLIYKYKIGGMPVVQKGKVVGIITESDILRAFIDMMGILSSSSRIDVIIEDRPGALKKAIQIIHENGGEIINIGQAALKAKERSFFFRLLPCNTALIRRGLEASGYTVIETMD